jgi:sulfoxide reductase heme-binding subunit YedZ
MTLNRALKPLVFLAAIAPFLWLVFRATTGRLTANPVEDITLTTGIWALRLLIATLAVTPLRRLTGWNPIIRVRRMLGLFTFFYATLHFLTYLAFDQVFALDLMLKDVAKRPFITAGFVAWLLMLPLAITSTGGWIRRLGRRWQSLHRLIYICALAAALHFIWKVKVAIGEPVYYAAIIGVLLGFRLLWRLRTRVPAATRTKTAG